MEARPLEDCRSSIRFLELPSLLLHGRCAWRLVPFNVEMEMLNCLPQHCTFYNVQCTRVLMSIPF